MTGVLDYGIGNIGSILNMIRKVGAEGAPVRTAEELSRCDRLILPGVGRFDAGMALLCQSGMRRALDRAVAAGVPLLPQAAKARDRTSARASAIRRFMFITYVSSNIQNPAGYDPGALAFYHDKLMV